MTKNYKNLFCELAAIIISAGNEIMKIYSGDIKIELKDDNSPLTAADLAANDVITTGLASVEFEGRRIPTVSEEAEIPEYNVRKKWDYFWLIDPLDGTKEFIKKNGEFTVNIALMKDDYPYLGLVYLPLKKILYFGGALCGSYRTEAADTTLDNTVKLPLNIKRDKTVLIAAGSRSHRAVDFDNWVNEEAQRRGCRSVEIITAGSSLKFCLAAEGLVDVYPRFGPTMEWDTAAAHAVAEGAGKRCIRFDGGKMEYNKPVMKNTGFKVV